MRSCGSCTMCCKLLAVPLPAGPKPAGKWCQHCSAGVGCKIYQDRPTACREFECVWLADIPDLGLTEQDRPDRSRVVLAPGPDGVSIVAVCPPEHPYAWAAPRILNVLRIFARNNFLAMGRCGMRHWVIGTKGIAEVPPSNLIERAGDTWDIAIPEDIHDRLGLGRLGARREQ